MKSHLHHRSLISSQIQSQVATQTLEDIGEMWSAWRRRKLPSYLFLALCFNAIFAPAVLAATGGELDRLQAWALSLLGIATICLSAYLFAVMFQPERF